MAEPTTARSLGTTVRRAVGRPARKAWRAVKGHLPAPVRKVVQPVATRVRDVGRHLARHDATLGTGLLKDRSWLPRSVTAKARATARKVRARR